MQWIITAIIFPVPFFHLWLHALLPWWRKRPYLYYLIFIPLVWLSALLFFKNVDSAFSLLLFSSTQFILIIGKILMLLGLFAIISSIVTLGPKRFFCGQYSGPNLFDTSESFADHSNFYPHPAYFGYFAIALGNFLSSGKFYLGAVFVFLFALMPIVIWI